MQAQTTGTAPNIPPSLMDNNGQYVEIKATAIDPQKQLEELNDLGTL